MRLFDIVSEKSGRDRRAINSAVRFTGERVWTQTATYDPEGRYIKRWIPELRDVDPARFTHAPEQKLATDYPLPMVDHAQEREIAWERFRASRTS